MEALWGTEEEEVGALVGIVVGAAGTGQLPPPSGVPCSADSPWLSSAPAVPLGELQRFLRRLDYFVLAAQTSFSAASVLGSAGDRVGPPSRAFPPTINVLGECELFCEAKALAALGGVSASAGPPSSTGEEPEEEDEQRMMASVLDAGARRRALEALSCRA